MVKNNVIGMVIFGAVFGRAIWWIKADKPDMEAFLHKLIDGLHKTMMNMALLILDYMPWAVIALLANTIAQKGLASILDVGIFIIALYVALIVQFIIQILAVMLHGVNPIHYLKKSVALLILAFTSRSSAGCLPVTIETLVTRLGVNQGTASFVAGFGTTAGMQGCAGVFPAMLIVYVCHLTGDAAGYYHAGHDRHRRHHRLTGHCRDSRYGDHGRFSQPVRRRHGLVVQPHRPDTGHRSPHRHDADHGQRFWFRHQLHHDR